MATDRRRAERDLREKRRLESELANARLRAQRRIVREAARQFRSEGTSSIRELSANLSRPMLEEHYEKVRDSFGSTVREEMPDDLAMTDEESEELAAALAAVLALRATTQADKIAATDQGDVDAGRAVAAAERDRVLSEEGRTMGTREFALVAAGAAERRMRGRLDSIVSYETQVPAELSKEAEVRELIGVDPIPSQGVPAEIDKEWVSQGDSVVRPDHRAADSQVVPVSQPFNVGGEFLMYPGDTSLGASLGNVVGCRCASVHDLDAVVRARRRRTG